MESSIDKFVTQRMEKWSIPGLSLAVVQDGELAYSRGYGFARLEEQRSMEACTPLGIGSTMKGMTALAVMQLAARGQVALGAPVRTYLPWFEVTHHQGTEMTVRQVLSMSAGLHSWLDEDDIEEGVRRGEWNVPHHVGALERRVRDLADSELLFAPGQAYAYANDGYAIAGLIVATVSGLPFETYLQEQVFAPLGMNDTGFGAQVGAAQGYVRSGDTLLPEKPLQVPGYRPAGIDVMSTAHDLACYLAALLKGDGAVPEGATQVMWTPCVQIDRRNAYGLGWYLEEQNGVRIAHHGGHAMTSGSALYLAPEQGLGVAVLSNVDDPAVDAIGQALFATLAGITAQAERPPSTFIPDRGVWDRYLGGYLSPVGPLRIYVEDGQLLGSFVKQGLHFSLEAYGDREFVTRSDAADVDGVDAVFEVAPDGTVRLTLAGKVMGVK
ncbi:MAG TPA: serine hydrolase domain-containing protein [Trueperaceae bacterium]